MQPKSKHSRMKTYKKDTKLYPFLSRLRLEERLKKAQDESSVVDTKSSDSVHREEQAEKNVAQLEQRLEEAEKKYEELKEMNQTIREALEEFVRQLDVA
ncbi:unnamed protein product [Rhizopus stolonifer]